MKSRELFLIFSGSLLAATCLAKLISLFGTAEALALPDALFGVQNRWVMLVAALAEAFVIGILVSGTALVKKLVSILWISLNFAAYRICLWLMGVGEPCPCMGNIYATVGLDSATMNRIMGGMTIVLVGGSLYFIWQFYRPDMAGKATEAEAATSHHDFGVPRRHES